ncbi:MAG: DUF1287 domain-containing protein [Deltaproteobacteria bacterium]|nr:DUF1287 domain-containing protein [Deltaproteobacteria bacterium]
MRRYYAIAGFVAALICLVLLRATVARTAAPVVFGVMDQGIFSDLDARVRYPLSAPIEPGQVELFVNKARRTLSVLVGGVPVKTYPVALGFTPVGDKQVQGDGKTPQGTYYVCERRDSNLPAKYGARSLLLSYPSLKDADRGLKKGQISRTKRDEIQAAISRRKIPPQNTKLGSSIRIHGGGVGSDWTAGCIALRDEDVIEIYDLVRPGTVVSVREVASPGPRDSDGDGIPDQVDAAVGALKTALNGAAYDDAYQKIGYPRGDVDRKKGVCTDVIIRALRNAGIDLQSEMQRDIKARPKAYRHISKPNANIDHRRVRNMLVYMKRHFKSLPTDTTDASSWLPGDVALFDTLPKNGPDHIGIISPSLGNDGLPLVVNNWTWGSTTGEMDLLSWCPVTHHFRVP